MECRYCGNRSGLRDKRGNCIGCGGNEWVDYGDWMKPDRIIGTTQDYCLTTDSLDIIDGLRFYAATTGSYD